MAHNTNTSPDAASSIDMKTDGRKNQRAVPILISLGLLGAMVVFLDVVDMASLRTHRRISTSTIEADTSLFRDSTVSKQPLHGPASSINYVPPIEKLTGSHIQSGVQCPYPLVPFYDRIVHHSSTDNSSSRIPKSIHLAWVRGYQTPQGRCISQDMMEIPNTWMEKFPDYNIYFHDDVAVDALFDQAWPEFPGLSKLMKACVQFGSAMRIDIWRQLILYRYGGLYGDFDMKPGPKLSQETIEENYSALFLSDGWNRPSQWFMAMAPKHPIAYFTIVEIMKRLRELKDVSNVKVVFTTGPDVLKHGYWNALATTEDYETVFDHGIHNSTLIEGPVRKLPGDDYAGGFDKELVPYPRDHASTDDYVNVTKKERVHKEMGSVHWKTMMKETRHEKPQGSCLEYLFWEDWNATEIWTRTPTDLHNT
jgi:Glycosyltransferase sugar-binding region containing DXD motif